MYLPNYVGILYNNNCTMRGEAGDNQRQHVHSSYINKFQTLCRRKGHIFWLDCQRWKQQTSVNNRRRSLIGLMHFVFKNRIRAGTSYLPLVVNASVIIYWRRAEPNRADPVGQTIMTIENRRSNKCDGGNIRNRKTTVVVGKLNQEQLKFISQWKMLDHRTSAVTKYVK